MYVLLYGVKNPKLTAKGTDTKVNAKELEVMPARVFFEASISGSL
jgi:hypothetical protein